MYNVDAIYYCFYIFILHTWSDLDEAEDEVVVFLVELVVLSQEVQEELEELYHVFSVGKEQLLHYLLQKFSKSLYSIIS